MAFAQPIPRPFNERGIWVYAPAASGVFGISNSKGWIHIGESSDIRAALLQHLQGHDSNLLNYAPTGFVFELCAAEIRTRRQIQLAAEYQPAYVQSSSSGASA
jgi:hypothetical protein